LPENELKADSSFLPSKNQILQKKNDFAEKYLKIYLYI